MDCNTSGEPGSRVTTSMVALLRVCIGASWRFDVRSRATRGRRAGLDPTLCSLACQRRLGLDGAGWGDLGIKSWHAGSAIQSVLPDIRGLEPHGEWDALVLSDGPCSHTLAIPVRVGLKLGAEVLRDLGDCGASPREDLMSARSRAAAHVEAEGASWYILTKRRCMFNGAASGCWSLSCWVGSPVLTVVPVKAARVPSSCLAAGTVGFFSSMLPTSMTVERRCTCGFSCVEAASSASEKRLCICGRTPGGFSKPSAGTTATSPCASLHLRANMLALVFCSFASH
mmetsp:Transcript_79581/g.192837  ORF Transcript_79581/g.192837 Transcript_79581/m.192837 type:complete len:284 (+) Transcript_79581:434-1285(+)